MNNKIHFCHFDNGELDDFITIATEFQQQLQQLHNATHVRLALDSEYYRRGERLIRAAMRELARRLNPD